MQLTDIREPQTRKIGKSMCRKLKNKQKAKRKLKCYIAVLIFFYFSRSFAQIPQISIVLLSVFFRVHGFYWEKYSRKRRSRGRKVGKYRMYLKSIE